MSRTGPPLSLADEAYGLLRRRLTRCEIPPGTAFTAREVAADLGLGLTPVREALIQLDRERLVDTLPRKGYVATPLTAARVVDVLDAWRLLAPGIAALAVRRATAGAGDRTGATARLLASQPGNEVLADVVRFLDGQVVRLEVHATGRLGPVPAKGPGTAGPSWAQVLHARDEQAAADLAGAEAAALHAFVLPRVHLVAAGAAERPRAAAAAPAHDAWQHLRGQILRGDLAPGASLSAREVSARLGIGLTPVREALGRLDHERLVVTRPRRGYSVTPVSWREVADATQVWALLAPLVLGLAVERAEPEQARAVVAAMEGPGDRPEDVATARSRGWELLGDVAGNAVLAEALAMVDGLVARLFVVLRGRPDSPLPVRTLDWEALFARRDPAGAREQLAGYTARLAALGDWAQERSAELGSARAAQIYQRSRPPGTIFAS